MYIFPFDEEQAKFCPLGENFMAVNIIDGSLIVYRILYKSDCWISDDNIGIPIEVE